MLEGLHSRVVLIVSLLSLNERCVKQRSLPSDLRLSPNTKTDSARILSRKTQELLDASVDQDSTTVWGFSAAQASIYRRRSHTRNQLGVNMTAKNESPQCATGVKSNYHWYALVGAMGLLAVSAQTIAQVDESNSPRSAGASRFSSTRSGDAGKRAIEEVVVTARRREENIQTVPIAISALSQEELTRANVNSLQDLQHLVPSLETTGYGMSQVVTLRGQGVNGLTGLPAVVPYLNEIPLPSTPAGQSISGAGLYYDLENVQVLKGPQGTLFGRNTTGGAILFQPKRPGNAFESHVQVGYGNHDNREFDAALNVPVVPDVLLVRVAASGQKRDGYTRSLGDPLHANGRDLGDIEGAAQRLSIRFKPTAAIQNDLVVDHSHYESNGEAELLTQVNPNGLTNAIFPQAALLTQQQALGVRTQVPTSGVALQDSKLFSVADVLEIRASDNVTFRNIAGYLRYKKNAVDDRDGTILPILDIVRDPARAVQYTEEAQIQGESLGSKLTWIAGGFYLLDTLGDFDESRFTVFGGSLGSSSRNEYESIAGYAQATYDLSSLLDALKVTGGLRYTWDDKKAQSRAAGCASAACTAEINGDSEALTWNVSLDYQMSPDSLIYVASRRGYRPGGANANFAGLSKPFDPEYVVDQEIGIKTKGNIAGMETGVNAALYHQKYKDAQVIVPVGLVNGLPVTEIQNAAAARANGAEFEAFVMPVPSLRLGANFSWLDYKFTKFPPGVPAESLTKLEREGRAKYTYGVSALYDVGVDSKWGDISLSTNWSWRDWSGIPKKFFTGGEGDKVPAYGLLNVGADWQRIAGTPVDASFFMTNVLNKKYVSNSIAEIYDSLGYGLTTFGPPRMYGVRLRYNFGAK